MQFNDGSTRKLTSLVFNSSTSNDSGGIGSTTNNAQTNYLANIKTIGGVRQISFSRVLAFADKNKPTEDLVSIPPIKKSIEINTNKGKLVVTTTSDESGLQNVILEKSNNGYIADATATTTDDTATVTADTTNAEESVDDEKKPKVGRILLYLIYN